MLLKEETDGTSSQMSNACLTWHVYYWIFTRDSWPRQRDFCHNHQL